MVKVKKSKQTEIWIELCDDIDDGMYDEGLQEIARTIQTRLDVRDSRRARRMIADLSNGTRVMLTNAVKPRYLEGMVGTVLSLDIENQAAKVLLDHLPNKGAGRPSNDGPTQKILIGFIHLVVLDDDTIAPDDLDAGDVGDDEDYDEDDDDD